MRYLNVKAARLFLIVILLSAVSLFATEDTIKSMRTRHSEIGKLMDKLYYDAGTRVDIIKYDLRELERQGHKNLKTLLKKVENKDVEMRKKWVELDKRRSAIFANLLSAPLSGKHVLTIEINNDKQGYLMIYWAEFNWGNGTEIKLNPKDFRTGAIRRNNKMLIVQNKQSLLNTASAGFDIPNDTALSTSPASLKICAVGYPIIAKECEISILVDSNIVFEGSSPFHTGNSRPFTIELKVPSKDFVNYDLPGKIWKEMPTRFDKLEKDIQIFGESSKKVADDLEQETAEIRKGLVYKSQIYPQNWYQTQFIRGMCFESDTLNYQNRHEFEPWYYHNYEYVAKAFYDAGINLVYSYCYYESQEKILNELGKMGIPYLQCGWDKFPPSGKRPGTETGKWSKPTFPLDHYNGDYGHKGLWALNAIKNFGSPEQRIQDALIFANKYGDDKPNFRGIAVDEPVIADDGGNTRGRKYPAVSNVVNYDNVVKAFNEHLNSRKQYLENAGISVPLESKPITVVKSESDIPLWMEWQIFKKEYMGNTYKELSDALLRNKYITLPVIMAHSFNDPQKCSYVSMASKLPMIATDLYGNGSVSEAMGMQLLHNAAIGQAYMVSGAGYSCKTPANFRRSMATSMIHADGNIQWAYTYASKYRDPFSYRKGGAETNYTADDRGHHTLENWKPEYWDIQVEMLDKMKKADRWLNNTKSVANVTILVSERLGIAMTAGQKFFPNFPQRIREIGVLYLWMLRRNRPLDLRFIETTTAKDMGKYQVILLHDEKIMTPAEVKRISDWVNAGGTLIVTGETSLYDEWARLQNDFRMANLLGVHYQKTSKGAKNLILKKDGKSVTYAANRDYVKVQPDKNSLVLAEWDTGNPAVISHKVGKGTVYYLSLKSIQWITGELIEVDTFLRDLVNQHVQKDPIAIIGAPPELEVQIRKKEDDYVVHLLDWFDGERTLDNLKLNLNLKGNWKIRPIFHEQNDSETLKETGSILLPPLKQYDIIILEKI